jgi:hypothetical protein
MGRFARQTLPYLYKPNYYKISGTTNACESFHSNFKANFYVSHPAIYRFIEILKDIQLNTYIKINSDDLPVTCTNLKYKKRVEYR